MWYRNPRIEISLKMFLCCYVYQALLHLVERRRILFPLVSLWVLKDWALSIRGNSFDQGRKLKRRSDDIGVHYKFQMLTTYPHSLCNAVLAIRVISRYHTSENTTDIGWETDGNEIHLQFVCHGRLALGDPEIPRMDTIKCGSTFFYHIFEKCGVYVGGWLLWFIHIGTNENIFIFDDQGNWRRAFSIRTPPDMGAFGCEVLCPRSSFQTFFTGYNCERTRSASGLVTNGDFSSMFQEIFISHATLSFTIRISFEFSEMLGNICWTIALKQVLDSAKEKGKANLITLRFLAHYILNCKHLRRRIKDCCRIRHKASLEWIVPLSVTRSARNFGNSK